MKRISGIFILLIILVNIQAQKGLAITQGESAILYSLPKTELCIEITTEQTKQSPGIFYQYSERYLATNDVITEEKSTCKLIGIKIVPKAIADAQRTYSITPQKNSPLNYISVDSKGILCGINIGNSETRVLEKRIIEKTQGLQSSQSNLLPLGEEFMMAGSSAKLAEGAAKQIYRLRESRMSLLTGDLEHLPADGSSLQSMLKGMNDLEQQLTELFIGKTTTSIQKKIITILPDSVLNDKILFRLSAFNGIVDTDDLSGAPFYISIAAPEAIKVISAGGNSKPEKSVLNTVIPANTTITITDGLNIVAQEKLAIPQLGIVVPLNPTIITSKNIKVKIDSQTGRLLSINE